MATQMQMQRMGSEPILECFIQMQCEHYKFSPWNQFFASNANPHADVTCEQGLRINTKLHPHEGLVMC